MSSNYHFQKLNVASAEYQFSPATPITNTIQCSKAIRDGKYLALPHSSAWQHPPPIKILIYIFRDVISLLARVFIFVIDRATQEVPIQNI